MKSVPLSGMGGNWVIQLAICDEIDGSFHHGVTVQAAADVLFRVVVVMVFVPEHCVVVVHDVVHDWLADAVPFDVRVEQITLHDEKGSAEQELDELEDIDVTVAEGLVPVTDPELSNKDDIVEVSGFDALWISVKSAENDGVLISVIFAETDGSSPSIVTEGGVGPGVQTAGSSQCVIGQVLEGSSGTGGSLGTYRHISTCPNSTKDQIKHGSTCYLGRLPVEGSQSRTCRCRVFRTL